MEHVVFFPGLDGGPAFRRFGSLDEAVRFVEHLRNIEGVTEVSVHGLSPVPLAFRAYYKVEVPPGDVTATPDSGGTAVGGAAPEPVVDSPVEPVAASPVEPVADSPAEPQLVEPQLVETTVSGGDASANGRRSLGFFAH